MLTFDTIKLQFPAHCLRSQLASDKWLFATDSDGGNRATLRKPFASGIPGITSAAADFNTNQIIIEGSAKILRDDYLKGFSAATIEQGISSMLRSTGMDACPLDVIESAKVLKVDTTNNIHIPGLMNHSADVVDALQAARMNSLFAAHPYKKKDNIGIAYNSSHKTYKARQIFYCKFIDMNRRNRANRDFFKTCSSAGAARMMDSMRDILRCELNSTDFKRIRQRHNIADNSLPALLLSDARPNLVLFDTICGEAPSQPLQLFSEYSPEQFTFKDIVEIEGRKNLFAMVGEDERLLRAMVKRYSTTEDTFITTWHGRRKTKNRAATKGVKHYWYEYMAKRIHEAPGAPLQYISEIRQQLSA